MQIEKGGTDGNRVQRLWDIVLTLRYMQEECWRESEAPNFADDVPRCFYEDQFFALANYYSRLAGTLGLGS